MTTELLSPKDILDQAFTGMQKQEIEALYRRILNFNKRINADPRSTRKNYSEDLITCATNAFIDEIHYCIHEKNKADHVVIVEDLINKLSLPFLSRIRKLEIGIDQFGMPLVHFDRLPNNMNRLTNLVKLFINGRPIEDLTPLSQLKLQFICADSTNVSDISCMNFSRMYWFNLQKTRISNVAILKQAPLIDYLRLENTAIVDFGQIEMLTEMEHISEFTVTGCKLPMFPERIGLYKQERPGHYKIENEMEHSRRQIASNWRTEYEDHLLRW